MRVADRIGRARSVAELAAVAGLFRAYAATLPFDLGFQDFETELATLPPNTPRRAARCSMPAMATARRAASRCAHSAAGFAR